MRHTFLASAAVSLCIAAPLLAQTAAPQVAATAADEKAYVLDAGNTGGAFGIPTFIRGLPRLFGVEGVVRF